MARKTGEPIQIYRGTTAQHKTYTGPEGELTYDTQRRQVVAQDGATPGGSPMVPEYRKVKADGAVLQVNAGSEATLGEDVELSLSITGLAADLVSGDANNGLQLGSDNKLFTVPPKADLILAENDKILHGVDNKVAADFSVKYDQPTGKLTILGYDGTSVVSEAFIPSSTSALKAVELVDGKPDAAGSDVVGDYHLTVMLKDNNGKWTNPVGVLVKTKKGVAANGTFTVPMPVDGASVAGIRVLFNGDDKSMDGTASPLSVVFGDTSTAAVSFTVTDGQVNGSVNFTPQIGIVPGRYLHFIWLLSTGEVTDTYVDVSDMVSTYEAGQGLTLTGLEFAVALATNGGLKFSGKNVAVDFSALPSADANNALKVGTDGRLLVRTVSADVGNLLKVGTDSGASLKKADLVSTVSEIIVETLTDGDNSIACAMISPTEGNQIQCDDGRLLVVSDYGTM